MAKNKISSSELLKLKIEPIYKKYHSSDTDWGIYNCKLIDNLSTDTFYLPDDPDSIIVTGSMPKLVIGRPYIITAEETFHPTYGKQLKLNSIYTESSSSKDDEQCFLATLVTELQFQNIIEVYSEPITAIKNETFDYTQIFGIGKYTAELIKEKVMKNLHLMSALSALGKFGITYNQIKRIVETYGNADVAVKKVLENPYLLYREVDGIGFVKADNIAQTIGIEFNADIRIEAGIMYAVEQEENNGNTYSYLDDIKGLAESILDLPINYILPYIENNKDFYLSEDHNIIALARTHRCELDIAQHLERIKSADIKPKFTEEQIDNYIEQMETSLKIQYSDKQKELFYKINSENIVILTGYAGTGKTASLNGCLNMLDHSNINYILMSPTAKASKVITKATGRPASTIHRGLGWLPTGFSHHSEHPLPYDLVVVDEVSMVDIWIMRSLLDAIEQGTKILFIGDPAQLESVSVGNVLQDMISSEKFSTIKLDKVFRQALESGILSSATSIRLGDKFYTNKDEKLELGVNKDCKVWFGEKDVTASRIVTVFNMCIKKYSIDDIMLIAPMKNGGSGVKILNELIQEIYNPAEYDKKEIDIKRCIFRVGDKVMHIRNMYDLEWLNEDYMTTGRTGVFNGDTGIISDINTDKRIIYVDYGDKIIEYHKGLFDILELAYCITVHKSQGSGSKVVIMALDTSHYMNLKRSLVYTGITRASELLFLVADKKALSIAINNDALVYKRTFLKDMLINYKIKEEENKEKNDN